MILASLVGVVVGGPPRMPAADSLVVTLLGTGTPQPRLDRMGPATLVEAGPHRLLFDAGRGVPIRLEQAGIRPGLIRAVFLTHLHSDHTVGLPDLWLTGWLPPFGGRTAPLQVIGPAGTLGLVRGLTDAFAEDLRMRTTEEGLPPAGANLTALEFTADTVVLSDAGVVVEAFAVDHGGELRPAYGYRITYRGRSVVISGDTRYSPNLIRHALDADVILHEVTMSPPQTEVPAPVRFILDHHTSPEEAAEVFTRTKPRLAVLTHFALPPSRGGGAEVTPAAVLAATRRRYAGRVEAGYDLVRIVVADSIRVDPAKP
ncbi:MAG: MBL fold metallo-hydrolase [Gemmatimonadales bacterium]